MRYAGARVVEGDGNEEGGFDQRPRWLGTARCTPAKGVDGAGTIPGSVVSVNRTEWDGGAEILSVGWSRGGFFREAFFLAHALVGLGCAVVEGAEPSIEGHSDGSVVALEKAVVQIVKIRVDADAFALLFEGDAIEACVTEGRIEGRALHQVKHVDRVRRD